MSLPMEDEGQERTDLERVMILNAVMEGEVKSSLAGMSWSVMD